MSPPEGDEGTGEPGQRRSPVRRQRPAVPGLGRAQLVPGGEGLPGQQVEPGTQVGVGPPGDDAGRAGEAPLQRREDGLGVGVPHRLGQLLAAHPAGGRIAGAGPFGAGRLARGPVRGVGLVGGDEQQQVELGGAVAGAAGPIEQRVRGRGRAHRLVVRLAEPREEHQPGAERARRPGAPVPRGGVQQGRHRTEPVRVGRAGVLPLQLGGAPQQRDQGVRTVGTERLTGVAAQIVQGAHREAGGGQGAYVRPGRAHGRRGRGGPGRQRLPGDREGRGGHEQQQRRDGREQRDVQHRPERSGAAGHPPMFPPVA